MRDFGTPAPRQLYENLTARLAQKLQRTETPQIGPEDVALVTDLLDTTRDRPADPRFWLSVRVDGVVIDISSTARARLGLTGRNDTMQDLAGRLKAANDDDGFIHVPDAAGQMILCRATRATGARHWLIEELAFLPGPDLAARLVQIWGFSPAETAIAMALLSGEQANEIAERTGRAVGTIRQGIKAVLTKMQAATQAKAVVKLALVAAERATLHRQPAGRPAVRHVVQHSDETGSPLHFWRFGAQGGQTVLLFHGALFGVFSSPDLVNVAHMFGMDVIAPERPGYGMTALPDGADPIAVTVERARAVLRAGGIDRVQILAHDVGTAYAFAFARAYPDCVSAIICAPATPPMTGWAQTADMPPLHRVSAFVTQKAPTLMQGMIKLGVLRATREGMRAIPQMVFADSAFDCAVMLRPEAYPVLENLYLSVTEQHGAGFIRDMFVTNLNWSDWLRDIACPVRMLHGAQSQTVSKTALERTCNALAEARLVVVADAGHTLPMTHPALAFREALMLCSRATCARPLTTSHGSP